MFLKSYQQKFKIEIFDSNQCVKLLRTIFSDGNTTKFNLENKDHIFVTKNVCDYREINVRSQYRSLGTRHKFSAKKMK